MDGQPRRLIRSKGPLAALAVLLLCLALSAPPGAGAAAAQTAASSEVEAYLERNADRLRKKLHAYNRAHRVTVNHSGRWTISEFSWDLVRLTEERVFLEVRYAVGDRGWGISPATDVFELRWQNDELEFVGHSKGPARKRGAEPAAGEVASAAQFGLPNKPESEVVAYLERNEEPLRDKLRSYNKARRVTVNHSGRWNIVAFVLDVVRLSGDRVFLEVRYAVGDRGWGISPATDVFELQWVGEALEFVGHSKGPAGGRRGGGWLETGDKDCVHNYYSARPCIDTLRKWREFAQFQNLELNPESAAIYQAYKHYQPALGDRLMARARGLPDPGGESVFGLQAEITSMNLTRYQTTGRTSCALNPTAPNPCPEIPRIFERFAATHGLPLDRATANMFEAYARGEFKSADVVYALSKGLEVPAYGYVPTGVAREVAELRTRLEGFSAGQKQPCSLNPYAPAGDRYRPCPEVLQIWRDFAARYQLADNAETARIFERYAAGEFRSGDQLLARAKGVSLEQLLEAAGVPSKGLVIEVYPGKRVPRQKGATGT